MFSIKESLKYGWDKFKTEKAIWATTLAVGILTILSSSNSHSGYSYPFGHGMNYGYGYSYPSFGILGLIAFIALLFARIGYTKILLKINDGEHFEWHAALEQLFKTQGVFWKFYLTALLYGLAVGLGLILLIIPGLFILPMYFFATLIAIDLKLGPIESMKESALITKGSRIKILGFLIVLVILNIIGVIAFGIGLFITIPISALATIYVYRKLSAEKLALKTQPQVQ